jgi:uncharacterized protein
VGSFNTVIKNLNSYFVHLPHLRYRLTLIPKTSSLLFDDILYLINIGAKTIVVAPNFYDTHWNNKAIDLFNQSINQSKKYIQQNNLDVVLASPFDKDYSNSTCMGGINEVAIDTEGNLYPCTFVVSNDKYVIGNVIDGINKEKLKEICNSIDSGRICDSCLYKSNCVGSRCKYLTNDIFTKQSCNPVCRFYGVFYD